MQSTWTNRPCINTTLYIQCNVLNFYIATVYRVLNNFVIKLLIHNPQITWNSRNTLLSFAKDACLSNYSMTLNCFSLSIVIFFENSSSKASDCSSFCLRK